MAYGDIYIRKNTSDTSAVPNAGAGNEDAGWDTLELDTDGGSGVNSFFPGCFHISFKAAVPFR